MVGPAVAKFHFHALGARREPQNLVAQAHAQQRRAAQQLFHLRDGEVVFRRIARAVGEHDAVRMDVEQRLRIHRAGEGDHAAVPLHQFLDDAALGAKIVQRDQMARVFRFRPIGFNFAAGNALHRVHNAVRAQRGKIHRVRIGSDRRVQRALFANGAGDFPRVHAAHAGNAPRLELFVHRAFAAEIGGRIADFARHIAAQKRAAALPVLAVHAIIADQWEGLHHDLPEIAGVGERFDVTARSRGKDHFPHRAGRRAKAPALEHAAIFHHDICPLHAAHPYAISFTRMAFCTCSRFSA